MIPCYDITITNPPNRTESIHACPEVKNDSVDDVDEQVAISASVEFVKLLETTYKVNPVYSLHISIDSVHYIAV